MVKHLKAEEWIGGKGIWTYWGKRYAYAYSKIVDYWMLTVSTKIGDIRYTMRVKNPTVAKQIVKLLES